MQPREAAVAYLNAESEPTQEAWIFALISNVAEVSYVASDGDWVELMVDSGAQAHACLPRLANGAVFAE
eukprot:5936595-Alexandrium_andersonii.AAC.1